MLRCDSAYLWDLLFEKVRWNYRSLCISNEFYCWIKASNAGRSLYSLFNWTRLIEENLVGSPQKTLTVLGQINQNVHTPFKVIPTKPNSGSPDLRPAPVRAASGRTLSSQGRTANIAACVRLKRTVVGRLLSIKFNVELLVKAVKMSSTSSCWRLGRRLDCLPPVRRAARRTRCPRCGHCFCPSAQWRSSRFTATLQLWFGFNHQIFSYRRESGVHWTERSNRQVIEVCLSVRLLPVKIIFEKISGKRASVERKAHVEDS